MSSRKPTPLNTDIDIKGRTPEEYAAIQKIAASEEVQRKLGKHELHEKSQNHLLPDFYLLLKSPRKDSDNDHFPSCSIPLPAEPCIKQEPYSRPLLTVLKIQLSRSVFSTHLQVYQHFRAFAS
jgi:hypothetical protein